MGPAEVSALSRDQVLPGVGGEAAGSAVTVGYCGKNKPKPKSPLPGLFFVGHDAGGGGYDAERQAMYRGLNSKDQYQSCFLHIEVFSCYMPFAENQARSNSGIYMQRRYEAQIMDSFGEEGLEGNRKGGLYASEPPIINAQ